MSPLPRALLVALALVSCDQASKTAAGAPAGASSSPAGLADHDSALAHRLVEHEGGVLLDVRTVDEHRDGHIEGSHNISHDVLAERVEEVVELVKGNKSTPIVVYCRSGRRAALAKEILVGHGFSRVTNLGGIGDW